MLINNSYLDLIKTDSTTGHMFLVKSLKPHIKIVSKRRQSKFYFR